MFCHMHRSVVLSSSLALAGLVMIPQLAAASQAEGRTARAEHAIAGEVKRVDHAAKTIVIHTADGIDDTVKFTERTAVRGVKDVTRVADASAKAALEGGSVILHYTGEGVDRTAVSVDHLGKRTLRIVKGTVVRVDEAGKFVIVKTAAGAEETFELTKDVVVDGARGIDRTVVATGGVIKKGTEVTVHYSDEGARKLVHLLRHA
jgi:hypothetical protein